MSLNTVALTKATVARDVGRRSLYDPLMDFLRLSRRPSIASGFSIVSYSSVFVVLIVKLPT